MQVVERENDKRRECNDSLYLPKHMFLVSGSVSLTFIPMEHLSFTQKLIRKAINRVNLEELEDPHALTRMANCIFIQKKLLVRERLAQKARTS